MKTVMLLTLVTATLTLFAQSSVSMTNYDLKIMNEIVKAMSTKEVKTFTEVAEFESVSAHYSDDGKAARFDIKGQATMHQTVACGELGLTIDRVTHTDGQSTWHTYSAVLDESKLNSYCELDYKDPRR